MQKILIIGCGLIGCSFARAVKTSNSNVKIHVNDKDLDCIQEIITAGFADKYQELNENQNFDLVLIASPLSSYQKIFNLIAKNINTELVIDFGSLNGYPFSVVNEKIKEKFISCHPIAGSEKSGFQNSDPDLFKNKKLIFSTSGNIDRNINKIKELSQIIGSQALDMNPGKHDKVFALISHVPQFLSFLTNDVSPDTENLAFLNKSFRLNQSNPEIWTDIFKFNNKHIENYYNQFFDNLCSYIEMVDSKQYQKIFQDLSYFNDKKDSNHINDFNDFDILAVEQLSKILFRLIIALSYVKIKDIDEFAVFAGNGYHDFISIIRLFQNVSVEGFSNTFDKSRKEILNYFDQISL